MTARPVLSIDTSFDPDSAWFATGRTQLYGRMGEQFSIVPFGRASAERRRIIRQIARAESGGNPFRGIVVSSHGRTSCVVDDESPDGILLSHESPAQEIELWARGRVLYFCCGETASGPLFDKLLEAGARTVVGFTGRLTATTVDGKFFWRQLDQELVTCALHDQLAPGFERARQQFLERVATRLVTLPEGAAREDLSRMMDLLASMVIRGAEKG
ncbi:hypothetical protein BE04_50200 [Sorangium cellulosum]|uniref:Uncharacterized protein n=2 Tax=Sorangium cellulosum TaxID=56 RepID=A0A150PPC9_SORCE|nr:hypothetical protein BE04_50200 [Sorangium cellulosum]